MYNILYFRYAFISSAAYLELFSTPPISPYFMCIFTLTQIVSAPGHPFLQTSSLPVLLPLQVKLIIFHCSITFVNY